MSTSTKVFPVILNSNASVFKRIAVGFALGSTVVGLGYFTVSVIPNMGGTVSVLTDLRDLMAGLVWSFLCHELVRRSIIMMVLVILCPILLLSFAGCKYAYTLWLCFTLRKSSVILDRDTTLCYVFVCGWMAKLIYDLSKFVLLLQVITWKCNVIAAQHLLVQIAAQKIVNTNMRNKPEPEPSSRLDNNLHIS